MASGFGTAVIDGMLDTAFGGNTTYSRPATLYLALLTTAHTSGSGGGTEVSTGVWTNYARLAIDNDGAGTVWAASDTAIYSNAEIAFSAATISGTAPVVRGWALMSASSGGNIHAFGPMYADRTVNNGDVFRFPSGQLSLTITNV